LIISEYDRQDMYNLRVKNPCHHAYTNA